jgi:membrane associated rhomboid family serine protease
MLPLSDDNSQERSFPFVNFGLIAVNFLVFFYELYQGSLGQANLDNFIGSYAVTPSHISQGQDLYTLVTSQFLHGGWAHILGNMLYLWIFGDNVEDALGHFPYLLYYLFCGIIAGLAQVIVDPHSTLPSLGASGAIAGVLGTYIVLFPRTQVKTLVTAGIFFFWTRLSAALVIGLWFLSQLLNGVASLTPNTAQTGDGGVAYWAHIGGFTTGMIIGLIFKQFINTPQLELPDNRPVYQNSRWGGWSPLH